MNIITALSEQLQKLINEHGSAAILRDHLALFKDQLTLYEKRTSELEAENTALKSENAKLKTENQNLKNENIDLENRIQIYEKSAQDNLLDQTKVKMLLLLSKQQGGLTADDIAQSLSINVQIIKFHLEELAKYRMVDASFAINRPRKWLLIQEGRRYLIEHELLS